MGKPYRVGLTLQSLRTAYIVLLEVELQRPGANARSGLEGHSTIDVQQPLGVAAAQPVALLPA